MFSSMFSIFNPGRELQRLCQRSFHLSSCNATLKHPNHKMVRDVKVRKTVQKYAFERINLNMLRKNKLIPQEIQEMAHDELKTHPYDASISRVHKRCTITSRPRGLVTRWRVSRFIFRHEADYNKLSGVIRAKW
ncbi:28S ribosomal protein S14, mitochondrial [Armadillidium vulgare]|nr:28S ribosomal protein S14, mitochondrial [Armadillidium vulgare]